MKFYQETTNWKDSIPNGIYLLDDAKSKMFAYIKPGSAAVVKFKNPIRIDTRGRTFKAVANTFNYSIDEEDADQKWEIKGSKGDIYVVRKVENQYNCSCSGYKFRGKCKHIDEVKGQ